MFNFKCEQTKENLFRPQLQNLQASDLGLVPEGVDDHELENMKEEERKELFLRDHYNHKKSQLRHSVMVKAGEREHNRLLESKAQMRETFQADDTKQDDALAQRMAARREKQAQEANRPESASPPSGPPPAIYHQQQNFAPQPAYEYVEHPDIPAPEGNTLQWNQDSIQVPQESNKFGGENRLSSNYMIDLANAPEEIAQETQAQQLNNNFGQAANQLNQSKEYEEAHEELLERHQEMKANFADQQKSEDDELARKLAQRRSKAAASPQPVQQIAGDSGDNVPDVDADSQLKDQDLASQKSQQLAQVPSAEQQHQPLVAEDQPVEPVAEQHAAPEEPRSEEAPKIESHQAEQALEVQEEKAEEIGGVEQAEAAEVQQADNLEVEQADVAVENSPEEEAVAEEQPVVTEAVVEEQKPEEVAVEEQPAAEEPLDEKQLLVQADVLQEESKPAEEVADVTQPQVEEASESQKPSAGQVKFYQDNQASDPAPSEPIEGVSGAVDVKDGRQVDAAQSIPDDSQGAHLEHFQKSPQKFEAEGRPETAPQPPPETKFAKKGQNLLSEFEQSSLGGGLQEGSLGLSHPNQTAAQGFGAASAQKLDLTLSSAQDAPKVNEAPKEADDSHNFEGGQSSYRTLLRMMNDDLFTDEYD